MNQSKLVVRVAVTIVRAKSGSGGKQHNASETRSRAQVRSAGQVESSAPLIAQWFSRNTPDNYALC